MESLNQIKDMIIIEDLKWLYTLAAVSTLIFIALYSSSRYRKSNQKPMAPSPPSLPIIGHLHLLKKPLHRTFDTLAAKYGPIFGLKLGIQYTVVVSSPAGYEECFRKNDVILADRPQVLSAKYLNWDSSTIGASNFGDHWKNMRRICNQELYSGTRLNMFVSAREDEVKSLIKSLFCFTKNGKQKVEMKSRVIESTFRTLVRMVTGKRFYDGVEDAVGKEFRTIIREITRLSDASNVADFIPILRYTKFGGYEKEMAIVHKRTDAVIQALIDEVKSKDVEDSALHNLLGMQEGDPKSIATKTIKGLVQEMITAGTDTSSAIIEWALCLLLNNPETLKKALVELDTVIGHNRLVEESDLPNLPYIQSIIKETMRLYPGAPLLVPHISSAECTILGYHIPKGSMIIVSAWFIHRDPNVWDEPLNFKPERFMNVDDEFSFTYKFLPFGIGRRRCPGAALSYKVTILGLAALVQCFEWERIGDDEIDMCEGEGLIMPKLKPLEAMCVPRKSMVNVLSAL